MPRLSIPIGDEAGAVLHALAEKRSITLTEVVRRSVSCLRFIEEVQEENDIFLVERDQNGQVTSRTRLLVV